jgi:hypothetical protein
MAGMTSASAADHRPEIEGQVDEAGREKKARLVVIDCLT